MADHEYKSSASFGGEDIYYYALPDKFSRELKSQAPATYRNDPNYTCQANLRFNSASSLERVTVSGFKLFESVKDNLKPSTIEQITYVNPDSSHVKSMDPSGTHIGEKSESKIKKKSLWQRLTGR